MATMVTVPAHPDDECIDDECIGTAGVMRRTSDNGHRVVLVVAIRGEHGAVADGLLAEGEQRLSSPASVVATGGRRSQSVSERRSTVSRQRSSNTPGTT